MEENIIESDRRVLIIEDEAPIADLMAYFLRREGLNVKIALDGNSGFREIDIFNPHLIILDLMLPDADGFDICKSVTYEYNIPIIIITAKSDIIDRLTGLRIGADDYITKPFDIREVVMRVKNIFRRIENIREEIGSKSTSEICISSNIKLYIDEHTVLKDSERIDLTPKEYELLLCLAQNKGKVFSRDQLLDKVWGIDYIGDKRTVDIHIQRLRKKLENKDMHIIETVFGVGYKLAK